MAAKKIAPTTTVAPKAVPVKATTAPTAAQPKTPTTGKVTVGQQTYATSPYGASVTPTKTAAPKTPGPQATPTPTAAPAVPVDWEQAAKELYGGYYAIIEGVPELQDLLRKAIGPPAMSDAQFQYELRQTTWWKTHADSARQWDVISQTDPASAQQAVDSQMAQFQQKALETFQVQLDDASLRRLATASLRGNWTQQQISNAIGYEATKSSTGMSQLSTGFIGQTVKNTAADYGLRLSDDTFNQWVGRIASGQDTKQSFQQYALNTAKTLFPGISGLLDSGRTFTDITDPYKAMASQILEINPQTIDFLDPKWTKAITFVDDKGQQRPMNYNEWGNYLRQTRQFGYEFTSEAQSRAYEVVNNLANLFGKV